MKKIITTLLAAVTMTAASTAAFADSNLVTCKDFTNFFDADELSQVIKQTVFERIATADSSRYAESGEYKSYSVYPDILKELSNGTPLKELLPDEYRWKIPSDDDYLASIALNDGVWEIVDRSKPAPELIEKGSYNDPAVRFDKINSAIEKIAIDDPSNITDVVCLYIYEYAGSFVCITTENNNYLVPFSSRPDFTKLTNGELYDLSEAYGILVQNFGEYKAPVPDVRKTEDYTLEEIKENLRVNGFDYVLSASDNADVKSITGAAIPVLPIVIIPAAAVAITITVMLLIWNKGSRKHPK